MEPTIVTEKKCGHCKVIKPASGFHQSSRIKGGLASWCRECDKASKDGAKKKGLCLQCRKVEARPNKTLCAACQKKQTSYAMGRKEVLRKSTLCIQCGQVPPLPTLVGKRSAVCEICYLKQLASNTLKNTSLWKPLRDKLASQKYKCPYTGFPLVLGDNASVDHIYPQSRFPQLKSDPDNFEWVDIKVNQLKRNLLPDEFMTLIRQILEYRTG